MATGLTVIVEVTHPLHERGLAGLLGELGHTVATRTTTAEPAIRLVELPILLRPRGDADPADTVPVVALLAEHSALAYAQAFGVGVSGVVSQDATAEELDSALRAAAEGVAVVPAEPLRELARHASGAFATPLEVAPWEKEWIAALAGGKTVAQLAEDAGYSERAMFRLLHDLYGRLGVANRTEAIVVATRRGWLP
jgi:DNA-binding NarL/FixJ family response regulator